MTKKLTLLLLFLACTAFVYAQNTGGVEMADTMRQNGKIYVVVAVVLTILAGIFLYLVRLDRKLTKLEKNHHNS